MIFYFGTGIGLVFIYLLCLNLFCIGCYGFDKVAAQRGWQRLPESKLHLLSLLGGWLGAMLAQRWFRHKTRKATFQTTQRRILLLHSAALLSWLTYLLFYS
ncbi:DUF1294 domain-containing protein [Marinomonas epiphytica]